MPAQDAQAGLGKTQSVALGIMLAYNQYKNKRRLLESNNLVVGAKANAVSTSVQKRQQESS